MPFGAVVKLDPAPEGGAEAPKPDMSKFSKANIQERAKEIMSGVKPDRETVVFDSVKPGEATVHISNGTPSVTGLELVDPKLTGLAVSLDKKKLSPMEQAALTLRWKPRDKLAKPTTMVHLKVAPSGQDITIQVNFSFAAVQPGSAALTRP